MFHINKVTFSNVFSTPTFIVIHSLNTQCPLLRELRFTYRNLRNAVRFILLCGMFGGGMHYIFCWGHTEWILVGVYSFSSMDGSPFVNIKVYLCFYSFYLRHTVAPPTCCSKLLLAWGSQSEWVDELNRKVAKMEYFGLRVNQDPV